MSRGVVPHFTPEEAVRGGKVSAAKRRAEREREQAEAAKPAAPLPAWLCGDTSGLPRRPPTPKGGG